MSIYLDMYSNILLFVGCLISLHLHKVYMSNVTYEVFENQTNWQEAADTCLRLNGTLIDSSDYQDVEMKINLQANRSYWSGNFTFLTKWVQLKGCFKRLRQQTVEKCIRFDNTETPLGWSCYIYCKNFSFFGIGDGYCKCLSGVTTVEEITQQNKCPSCKDSSRFQCGKDDHTAVYAIRPQPNSTDINNLCASYECVPLEITFTLKHISQVCTNALEASCTGGIQLEGYKTWENARNECEVNNTYMLQPPGVTCNMKTSQLWDNRHRAIAWTTTESELFYGIPIHRMHRLLECSSVNGYGTKNGDCNTPKHGFICKIGNFTNDHSTTLCNISKKEPETSTISPSHTTTGEPAHTDFSITVPTSSISHIDTIEGNSTAASNTVTYIAIGAAAGGFLVIVLIIVVIICTCKNRSRKDSAEKTASDYKKELDVDDGEINHMAAAERYVSIKSDQASVKYTVENGKVAVNTSEPEKSWGGGYEQVVLPEEEPDSGFLDHDGNVDNIKQAQPSPDIHEASNEIQNTEEEDDYAEVDSESVTERNNPEIRIQSASTKMAGTNYQQEDEGDYDHFGQTDQGKSVSSNYDHVHLRNSRKSRKENNQNDSENYDHIPGAGGRREDMDIDSTYDHTQMFGLRDSSASMSSNYDHVVLLKDQVGQEDSLNRISDDYDHTSNVSKVEVAGGERDSNYTHITLPDSP